MILELLEFTFASFWRFLGMFILIAEIGYFLALIVDAFTPFYGLRYARKRKGIEMLANTDEKK